MQTHTQSQTRTHIHACAHTRTHSHTQTNSSNFCCPDGCPLIFNKKFPKLSDLVRDLFKMSIE